MLVADDVAVEVLEEVADAVDVSDTNGDGVTAIDKVD